MGSRHLFSISNYFWKERNYDLNLDSDGVESFFLHIDKFKKLLKNKIETQYVYEALQTSSNCYVGNISETEFI